MYRAILFLTLAIIISTPFNPTAAANNIVTISTSASKTIVRDLNRLEDLFFDIKYPKDEIIERIERLEYRVFGALQEGDESERVSRLKKAAVAFRNLKNSQMAQTYSPYYEQSIFRSGRGWRGLFNNWGNNFGNYYSGYPTGVTPPVYYGNNGIYNNSYCTSPDLYGAGMSKGYRTNTGWGNRYTTSGAKSGVTILD